MDFDISLLTSLSIEYLLAFLDHKLLWFEHLWYCSHVLIQSAQNIQRSANQNRPFIKCFLLRGETTTLTSYSCTALRVLIVLKLSALSAYVDKVC